MFQFYALYPTLTVTENLAYPLHAERIDKAELDRRVGRVLEVLQLGHAVNRIPGQLSEGEKQRVAVGRAIIRDLQCFLFDEPLSRLDIQLRETMRSPIKELLANLSKATVIVTHDQLEALTMADRIAVMNNGVIEQFATPHNVFARPANLFVAGFFGTPQMNLLEAHYLGHEGGARFCIGEQDVVLDIASTMGRLRPAAACTIGVRPRAIELGGEAGPDTIAADIDIVEPMGAETLLHLVDGAHDVRMVVDRRVAAPACRGACMRAWCPTNRTCSTTPARGSHHEPARR